ncbi:hypothetical protein BDV96DRAFT_132712 [Lophiotrema nucula]|uniref:Uncharacterized protein n=1 Tax=Lophiotrema nucula TaxID=690887 RepID=A0A6A5ZRK0_9PLEO|nr:hypothetical protein BDV96DRAFT_132712 [Lophiotrema nucula]
MPSPLRSLSIKIKRKIRPSALSSPPPVPKAPPFEVITGEKMGGQPKRMDSFISEESIEQDDKGGKKARRISRFREEFGAFEDVVAQV